MITKERLFLTWSELSPFVIDLRTEIRNVLDVTSQHRVKAYGVPRGGWNAVALIDYLEPVDSPEEAEVIIDDIIDSGDTRKDYEKYGKPFLALIDLTGTHSHLRGNWVVFPWEKGDEDAPEQNVRRILSYLGEDPNREGLADTPKRFLKAMKEHTQGYSKSAADLLKVSFDLNDTSSNVIYDQIILSGPLPFNSMCEHHLAPFEGTAWIGYLPGEHGRVVGLSKLARVLDIFAQRLQVQERLTVQIADAVEEHLCPAGVGVLIRSRHLCQCHRGVKKEGRMITSILRGTFKDLAIRSEFLELVKLSEQ